VGALSDGESALNLVAATLHFRGPEHIAVIQRRFLILAAPGIGTIDDLPRRHPILPRTAGGLDSAAIARMAATLS